MLKPTTSDFPRNGFFGISAVLGKMKTFEPRSLMPVFAWCLTLTLQMTPIKEVSALQQEWAFIIYSISNASKIKFRVLVLQLLDFLSFPVLIIKFPFRTLSPNPFLDPLHPPPLFWGSHLKADYLYCILRDQVLFQLQFIWFCNHLIITP